MNLALFDFDGTITNADTFTPFIYFAANRVRIALGLVLLAPLIVGYKLGLVSASTMRRAVVSVGFRGRTQADILALGARYSKSALPSVVRPNVLARIQWHQAQGDTVVIVSASLDAYLTSWCRELGLELICSELEASAGKLTGRYAGGDCSGAEKSRRVRARFDLGSYRTIYAYGDTHEDRELLELAHVRYFRGRENR